MYEYLYEWIHVCDMIACRMTCDRKLRNDDIRQALDSQTTLLNKEVLQRLRWFGHMYKEWQLTEFQTMHVMQKSKEKEAQADPDYDGQII